MKAVLFSMGTRGDVEPFLAVAEILKERDWDVVCVFPEQFREVVEEMGLRFEGFSRDFLDLLEGKDAKRILGGAGSPFKRIKSWVELARRGMKLARSSVDLQRSVQQEENPDRVIYHPKCNFSLVWGMANPGKAIMLSPVPGMAHPIDQMTVLWGNYGRTLNRLSFWIVNTIKALTIRSFARKFKNDYPSLELTVSSIKRQMLERERTIYAVSPTLFPKPDYWPAHVYVAGYYERNKSLNWRPDERLREFLKKYEKIVLITFGSMTSPDPKGRTQMIVNVLKRDKIPAIINTSWGGLEKIENSPEHIFFVDNVPYDWLFPKMYAVVHHGGSGTTHTAVKNACPSLVVSHIVDQFFWSRTISERGLGPVGLPIRKFNEIDFEAKLLDLYANEDYKSSAAQLSERVKSEGNKDELYKLIAS